jgi:tetratricopeptide (TPR) repeat protein
MRGAVRAVGIGCVSGLLIALAGCAARSPHQQEFVELRTRNFLITSSLSPDGTIAFARSLEYFHTGVLALLGLSLDAAVVSPTPVYLFDDRSLGRPFAVASEAAYLLDEVEAPVLVFRGARDFEARATPDLRHRYAHRVLRDHARTERPLWYEEGVSQLARTVEEVGNGVLIGRADSELKQVVLDWHRGELSSVMQRFDLSDDTRSQRALFEAQSWAIAHTLEFSGPAGSGSDTLLDAYRRALDAREAEQQERALAAIGLSREALEARIYRHLEADRSRVRLLEPRGFDPSGSSLVPISRAESRTRLGELALLLDRPVLAADYFERALDDEPDHPRARLGHAFASAVRGEPAQGESLALALALPADPPAALQIAAGDAARAIAAASSDPELRDEALALARERYADALRSPSPSARAEMGMAESYLEVEGEDPAGAALWIEAARKRRGGSLLLELRLAQSEASSGAERSAQIRARNVISRTHDRVIEKQARALLESRSPR